MSKSWNDGIWGDDGIICNSDAVFYDSEFALNCSGFRWTVQRETE